MRSRIEELEYIISTLDNLYYVESSECVNPINGEIVSDNEYDGLRKELFNLNPNSKIFKTITAETKEEKGNKIKHSPPMTSINKCNGTEEEKKQILEKWFFDCSLGKIKKVPDFSNEFSMSYKHDGIALSCNYKDGLLINAGLRSKSGKDGIDVTEKVEHIQGVPKKLPIPISCTIRGEIETPISVFKEVSKVLGDKAKTNPRSHTSGSIFLKDIEEIKIRGLSFTAYNILNIKSPPYKTEVERSKWAKEKLKLNFVKVFPFSQKMINVMEENHKKLDFMVDGIVISVNDLAKQEELGNTGDKDSGNPKGKIAYKFKDEIKIAKIKDIIWQTGRTGNITPVLIFDGIQLEGTTVSKCTAHNWGIIKNNKIGIGSEVEIIKSGKIIPKLKKVISAKGEVNRPQKCKECEGELKEVQNKDALSIICDNILCPAQKIKRFNHYLSVVGVKGISESTLYKLDNAGLINELSDLYRLMTNTLINKGFPTRTSALIVARIKMMPNPEDIKDTNELSKSANIYSYPKIKIPLEILIASFGIDGAGKEVGRILTEKYSTFEIIRNLTKEELEKIDGIGPITSSSINKYFEKNKEEINSLLTHVEPIIEEKTGKLKGKTFVLSGSLEDGKKKWEKIIKDNGGSVKSSINKNLDFLVAGEGSGLKSEKAKKLGIKIIYAKDVLKMV